MLFQFAYPFKIEAFFLISQVLINSTYTTFIASKIPTMRVSFPDFETDRSQKELNLENTGDEEEPRSCIQSKQPQQLETS